MKPGIRILAAACAALVTGALWVSPQVPAYWKTQELSGGAISFTMYRNIWGQPIKETIDGILEVSGGNPRRIELHAVRRFRHGNEKHVHEMIKRQIGVEPWATEETWHIDGVPVTKEQWEQTGK